VAACNTIRREPPQRWFFAPERSQENALPRGFVLKSAGYNRRFWSFPMRLLGKALTFDDVLLVPLSPPSFPATSS